jgi:hypothetical protein
MDKSEPNSIYGTTEQRINTFGQVEDSRAVYRVFNAVRSEMIKGGPDEVIKYMLQTYGIKLNYISDPALPAGGGWDMSFVVFDEELYTFFLLKYN